MKKLFLFFAFLFFNNFSYLIIVKHASGKEFWFDVEPQFKIKDLKTIAEEDLGVDRTQIEFTFVGKVLDNNKTVQECNICEYSTLNLIIRPSAGFRRNILYL